MGYDYSQDGFYFITICTKNREWLFGNVIDGKMVLSEYGETLNATIQSVGAGLAPARPAPLSHPVLQPQQIQAIGQGQALSLPHICISNHCVMPNHVHIMIEICNGQLDGHNIRQGQTLSLPDIVREIKSKTAIYILNMCKTRNA